MNTGLLPINIETIIMLAAHQVIILTTWAITLDDRFFALDFTLLSVRAQEAAVQISNAAEAIVATPKIRCAAERISSFQARVSGIHA